MPGNRLPKAAFAGLLAAAALILSFATAAPTLELPQAAPAPEFRDLPPPRDDAAGEVPLPEPRPERGEEPGQPPPAAERPTAAPLPAPGKDAGPPAPMLPADPRSALRADPSGTMPAAESLPAAPGVVRGRVRGAKLGIRRRGRLLHPYPLMLSSFGGGIALEPAAEDVCPMAEASARFARRVASPAAKEAFGKELKSMSQASGLCLPRRATAGENCRSTPSATRSTSPLSRWPTETTVAVELRPEERGGAYFSALLRKAACGPFKHGARPGQRCRPRDASAFRPAAAQSGGTFCQ